MSRRRLPSLRVTGARKGRGKDPTEEEEEVEKEKEGEDREEEAVEEGGESRLDMSLRIHPSTFPR